MTLSPFHQPLVDRLAVIVVKPDERLAYRWATHSQLLSVTDMSITFLPSPQTIINLIFSFSPLVTTQQPKPLSDLSSTMLFQEIRSLGRKMHWTYVPRKASYWWSKSSSSPMRGWLWNWSLGTAQCGGSGLRRWRALRNCYMWLTEGTTLVEGMKVSFWKGCPFF